MGATAALISLGVLPTAASAQPAASGQIGRQLDAPQVRDTAMTGRQLLGLPHADPNAQTLTQRVRTALKLRSQRPQLRRVAGAATGTIGGVLRTSTGSPIGGATIAVVNVTNGDGAQIDTDSTGSYTTPVPPGRYAIAMLVRGQILIAPQVTSLTGADIYPVAAGATVTADLTMKPMGIINGNITHADGSAAADVVIAAFAPDNPYTPEAAMEVGVDGGFMLDTLAGPHRVLVLPKDSIGHWTHGQIDGNKASLNDVPVDGQVTVNEQLFPTGTVTGRLLGTNGKPLAKATVEVDLPAADLDRQQMAANTNAKGVYQLKNVPAGTYRVRFQTASSGRWQYAPGKPSTQGATLITVNGGKTTTVNDRLVAAGSATVRLADRRTGKLIKAFCVSDDSPEAGGDPVCTKNGTAVLKNLAPRPSRVSVTATTAMLHAPTTAVVKVTAGKNATVTARADALGGISGIVVDRKTKKPVQTTTITAIADTPAIDDRGTIIDTFNKGLWSTALPAGRYRLFVDIDTSDRRSLSYGRQWVGKAGGTGQRELAAVITVTNGKVTKAPRILLDKSGTIAGRVSNADGSSGKHVNISPVAQLGPISNPFLPATDINGDFIADGYGPYSWPVLANPFGGALQWSGGATESRLAARTTVRSGKRSTFNLKLKASITLRGAVSGVPKSVGGLGAIVAFNARTGDQVSFALLPAGSTSYQLPIMGGQPVRLMFLAHDEAREVMGWYGGRDYAHASTVTLPATGEKVVDITIK